MLQCSLQGEEKQIKNSYYGTASMQTQFCYVLAFCNNIVIIITTFDFRNIDRVISNLGHKNIFPLFCYIYMAWHHTLRKEKGK